MPEVSIARRRFLIATGWLSAGITTVVFANRQLQSALPSLDDPEPGSGLAWLQMNKNGRCRMFCPRSEMGQNISVGLAQIAAEELNIAIESIEVVYPSTDQISQVLLTVGSQSVSLFSRPVAIAAATLREALRTRASRELGVKPNAIFDAEGGFKNTDGRTVSYGELVASEAVVLEADSASGLLLYSFDSGRAHRQIGRAAASHQFDAIVTGDPIYASDVKLENMLFGRVVQPPARNAKLVQVDATAARRLDGVVQVVIEREGSFVGIIGERPGAVSRALAALKVKWEVPAPFDQQSIDKMLDIDNVLAAQGLEHVSVDGEVNEDSGWDIDLRFDVQVQSHAMQEPRTAVARFTELDGREKLDIWTGSQDAFAVKRHAARDMQLSTDQVVVHQHRIGGGFGGRAMYDVERDAVRLARAAGRPVKVQWSREDEFRAARHRPASGHRVRLRADGQGRLTDWWHAFVSGHILFARERLPGWLLPIVRLGGDDGVARGSVPPYAATRQRVEYSDVDLPIDLGSWRSLGAAPNIFAIESAIDELARSRGADPVDFRLENLDQKCDRLAQCLRRTRALAEKVAPPAGTHFGRGYACGIYKEHSYVAVSADVSVDETGSIRVSRLCCAQDVGLLINPDQVRAQVEGNLVWGLGMALFERVEIGDSEVLSTNFDKYRIPRIQDIPDLEIELLNRPDIPPAGAGEAALVAVTPAIANALRDATGVRSTSLPIRA